MSQTEVQSIFDEVIHELSTRDWFRKGKWQASTHPFPAKKPEFLTFHVFKNHWFNEAREGIHIESFLAFDPKARKKTSITLHLLHLETVPGTKVKRKQLAVPIVDSIFDEISAWDGYQFRAGKYGLQPFAKGLDGKSESFKKDLLAEITRLCKMVGPVVDKALKEIQKT